MRIVIVLFCLAAISRQVFAQEDLLGASRQDAIAFAAHYDSNAVTPGNIATAKELESAKERITIARMKFERWNHFAYVRIYINDEDTVCKVEIGFDSPFKPEIRLSSRDRKAAIRELTKKFGNPRFDWYEADGAEQYRWEKVIGKYRGEYFFTYYPDSGKTDFSCELWPRSGFH